MEPPKPARRTKNKDLVVDEGKEQRQNAEGVCKRRLDLSIVQGKYLKIHYKILLKRAKQINLQYIHEN